jgi:hypothetical protein
MSAKTDVIERLFKKRWNPTTATLSNPLISLEDVAQAIREHNIDYPTDKLSDRNPANFFKDFIRNKRGANKNWPQSILRAGCTGRQVTGHNACFEFIQLSPGQKDPFPLNIAPAPGPATPRHQIESASLPLASRRLGRTDEPWLIQVLVRLHVIETHLALFSKKKIVQMDHLQMSVKLAKTEIDALFLALEELKPGSSREIIICCEAKGRKDDILEDQILRQAKAVFKIRAITQNVVIPIAVKAIAPSQVHVIEFDSVTRANAPTAASLNIASEAVYEFVPAVPGIGK